MITSIVQCRSPVFQRRRLGVQAYPARLRKQWRLGVQADPALTWTSSRLLNTADRLVRKESIILVFIAINGRSECTPHTGSSPIWLQLDPHFPLNKIA